MLQCIAVCSSMLQCVVAYCSVSMTLYDLAYYMLQCIAVCCSVLQCVAACCSVLMTLYDLAYYIWQCIAVCCSVLQCVAACCSVLQCVAVCLYHLAYYISLLIHMYLSCTGSILQFLKSDLYSKCRKKWLLRNCKTPPNALCKTSVMLKKTTSHWLFEDLCPLLFVVYQAKVDLKSRLSLVVGSFVAKEGLDLLYEDICIVVIEIFRDVYSHWDDNRHVSTCL